jgi:hypothetical protein
VERHPLKLMVEVVVLVPEAIVLIPCLLSFFLLICLMQGARIANMKSS